MAKSYISIVSEKGIVYEGEGSILKGNWKEKISLNDLFYNLLEIRQEDNDLVTFRQCIVFREDSYAITEDTTILEHTCSQGLLERLVKNNGEK